jgi:metallophosphoesterase superfamily enzyme
MTLSIISDIHLDFWIDYKKSEQKQTLLIKKLITDTLKPQKSDILAIAGDIGHYNHQNFLFVKEIAKYYDIVFIVFGNHDLYLLSNRQKKIYKNSLNRLEKFKEALKEVNNVVFLNGEIYKYKNYKIFGSGLWYDLEEQYIHKWIKIMNDAKYIDTDKIFKVDTDSYGKIVCYKFNPFEFFKKECEKLQKIEYADIIITHVPPILPYEKKDTSDEFYFFNGKNEIERINPQLWIFGHIHQSFDFHYKKTRLISNPLGYKGEKDFSGIVDVKT